MQNSIKPTDWIWNHTTDDVEPGLAFHFGGALIHFRVATSQRVNFWIAHLSYDNARWSYRGYAIRQRDHWIVKRSWLENGRRRCLTIRQASKENWPFDLTRNQIGQYAKWLRRAVQTILDSRPSFLADSARRLLNEILERQVQQVSRLQEWQEEAAAVLARFKSIVELNDPLTVLERIEAYGEAPVVKTPVEVFAPPRSSDWERGGQDVAYHVRIRIQ